MPFNKIHPANKGHVKTQAECILAWLKRGNKITQLQAYALFNCTRLGGRIYDLKGLGYKITGKMIKTRSGKVVKQYSLKGL